MDDEREAERLMMPASGGWVDHSVVEAASWRLASELMRRHLGGARLIRGHLAPVARPVRRYEGQRRQTAEGARGENARLKKLLAEAELDKAMLKELAEGNL